MNAMQLKMARVALSLTVRQTGEACGVSHDSITKIEAGEVLKPSTMAKVRSALEAAGVIFVEENGEGPGVRLRKVKPSGPATDVVEMMDAAIEEHEAKRS